MANNYQVNYEDERLTGVQADKEAALNEVNNTYGSMIGEADKYYQAQVDASKDWANTQSQLQQEQTDFTIQEIEQQKQQAQKDYKKEQSGAYVDWQKQSAQHGVNAEQMAQGGMTGTGFSESSQVAMYNTYQNRVATARESYNQAILNYNNSITEARLQNNSVLAQIACEALQTQLELSLQGFQYKNNLILEQANQKQQIENTYWQRQMDMLDQINTENAFAYQQERDKVADQQWQTEFDYAQQRDKVEDAQWEKSFNEQVKQWTKEHELNVKQYEEDIRQFDKQIAYYKARDEKEYALEIKQLEQQKKLAEAELAEEKRQFNATLAEEKRQFNSSKSSSSSSSSSGGSSSIKKGTSSSKSSNNKYSAVNIDSTSHKSSSKSSKPPVDMNSVMALDEGPISAQGAMQLVKQGLAETYVKNGKTYFRKKDVPLIGPFTKRNTKSNTSKKPISGTNGKFLRKNFGS